MYRRVVYTLIGALAGYVVGAIAGMVVFASVDGYRSVAIVEEPNRNRWTFVAAAGLAVIGGLIAWWRSYSDAPSQAVAVPAETDTASDADAEPPATVPGAAGTRETSNTAPDE